MNLSYLFWLVVFLIFSGWLLSAVAFYKLKERWHALGERLLFSGLAAQLLYIVAAYIELDLTPFKNLAGLFLFGSLLVLLLYFLLDFFFANPIFEVIFPPLTLFFMLLSMLLTSQWIQAETFLEEIPVFGHFILSIHAGLTMLGYLLFGVASMTSIYFLVAERQIKAKTIHLIDSKGPSLGFLDRLNHGVIATGFVFITVGLLVGITMKVLTHAAPPELNLRQGLPLLTWLVYAGFLLDRSIQGLSLKTAALWAIGGFFVVMASFAYEIHLLVNR